VIAVEGLTRRFGATVAVDGMSFSVDEGEIFGLIGPDGAGKTTLLRMLAGVLEPTGGTAQIGGVDVGARPEDVKSMIGYMPQAFALYHDMTVAENLRFVAEVYGVPRAELAGRTDRLLGFSRLAPFAGRLADHLSGGMRQKLALAATLIHEPAVILLDEPTTGVDPSSRREFWQILYDLNREGMTVVVATPYMDEAERCGRVALVHRGRVLRIDRPESITSTLPDTVLEVVASPRRSALAAARALPEVLEAAVFGSSLHLTVRNAGDDARVRAGLERAGVAVASIRPVPASLEDVFVSLLRQGSHHAT
jgi:ABC-2 type transport system ATP-binding protein